LSINDAAALGWSQRQTACPLPQSLAANQAYAGEYAVHWQIVEGAA